MLSPPFRIHSQYACMARDCGLFDWERTKVKDLEKEGDYGGMGDLERGQPLRELEKPDGEHWSWVCATAILL